MGLLDGLIGNVLGQLAGGAGQQNPLLQAALQLVQNHPGGLAGFLQQFQSAGLQSQAVSWVGTGKNLPISGSQLSQALGNDTIAAIAAKLGMSGDQVSGGLANVLPQLIDKLTPSGAIDQGSIEQQLSGFLKALSR